MKTKMSRKEIAKIESSTPFLKPGKVLSDDELEDNAHLTIDLFEYIDGGKKLLGKGAYGQVKLVKHTTSGELFALKIISKATLKNKDIDLMREVEIHKRLKHENVIRLINYFEDEVNLYLILEYASKGSLFHLIKKKKYLTEDEAFFFFVQACAGIYFLHSIGLIHRDIKPENMLIGRNHHLKICDFGWCVATDNDMPRNTF
jgi:serine/threonine protein kinase